VKNAAKKRMLLYMQHAYDALEAVNKESALKMPLKKLAESLIQREV
jgi:hypothetical protein